MAPKPDSEAEKTQPHQRLESEERIGVETIETKTEAESGCGKSSEPTKNSSNIVWYRRFGNWFRKLVEEPTTFVTTLATIVMAVFSVELYCVSNRQWRTMRNTLSYQIRQTQARLAVTNLNIFDFPQAPYATFCVENDGHALADEIGISMSRSVGTVEGQQRFGPSANHIYKPNVHMRFRRTMAEGTKDCSYRMLINQMPNERPTFSDIAQDLPHTGLWIEVAASYRDTATDEYYPEGAVSCVYWETRVKQFLPCIVIEPPSQHFGRNSKVTKE